MKAILILSLFFFSVISMSEIKLSIEEKLQGQASEITFIDSKTFIASGTGRAQVWKNDKPGEILSMPGYIGGKLTYSGNVISSGVVSNSGSDKTEYKEKYIASVVSAFVPHYQGREDQFEISYALPLPEKDRLVLALRFRPTRHPTRKDPKPEPNEVVALLKLSDASLVAILDSGFTFMRRPVVNDNKLFYGCNNLKCWDLTTGKQEAAFDFLHVYAYTAFESGVLVFLENGEIWNAEPIGKNTKLATLPVTIRNAVYLPEHKALIAGDNKNGLHVITMKDSVFKITQTLELEREADGIYLHPDRKYVYVPVYISDYILKIRVG